MSTKSNISSRTRLRRWRIGAIRYLRMHIARLPQGLVLVLIALLIGLFSGVMVAVLKAAIEFIRKTIIGHVPLDSPHIGYLIWPLVGIILTSIFQRYVVRGDVSHGTRIIRQRLDSHNYKFKSFSIFNPLIGCAMTIGFGASGGSEGPAALSGSAIGSAVGKIVGVSQSWKRLLIGIGGGAGIAAIFKSPIGGVLFTLEVLRMQMTTLPVVALILACILASTTAYLLSDFTFDIAFYHSVPYDPHISGWVIMLGVFCGLYSVVYNYVKKYSAKWFTSIRNPWVAALVTGGVLSVCTFLFPAFYGEGFGVITSLVNGVEFSFTSSGLFAGKSGFAWMIVALVAMMVLKSALVSAANSGGGVAGDFVPTLFAGALAGYLFSVLCNTWFHAGLQEWFFALVGMGAVMAGTIHAPLMALFILCETTNTFGYILPYLLAVSVSYAVVKIITPMSWYDETGHDDVLDLLKLRNVPSLPGDDAAPVSALKNQTGNAGTHANSGDNTPQGRK